MGGEYTPFKLSFVQDDVTFDVADGANMCRKTKWRRAENWKERNFIEIGLLYSFRYGISEQVLG